MGNMSRSKTRTQAARLQHAHALQDTPSSWGPTDKPGLVCCPWYEPPNLQICGHTRPLPWQPQFKTTRSSGSVCKGKLPAVNDIHPKTWCTT